MIASINIEIMNRKFLKIRFSFNFYFHILNLFFISTCLLWTSSLNDISDTAYVNIFSTCENEIKVISKPYKKHTNLAYVWLKKYDTLLEDVGNFYKTYYETDESFLNDTTAINTKEEFRKKIINFYLKTHSGKTVLDRITKKIDHALLLISQYSADETEFFRPLNVPFFRYTLIICIIELPESAIDESFDYFFK